MSSSPPSPNPYESPTLYEPAAARRSDVLQVPIIARGKIGYEDRRLGLLLSGWATFEDWGDFLIYNGIGLLITGIMAVTVSSIPLLGLGGIFLLRLVNKFLRSRYLLQAAAEAQAKNGNLQVEREITNDGIVAQVNGERVLTSWIAYAEGRLGEQRIILLTERRENFQIFPRTHFASDADWGLFQKIVKRRVKRLL